MTLERKSTTLFSYVKKALHIVKPPKHKDIPPKKDGLSLKELWKKTPVVILKKSKYTRVLKHKLSETKGGMPVLIGFVVFDPELEPKPMVFGKKKHKHKFKELKQHRTIVIGKEALTELYKQDKILVSCDCAKFAFAMEYPNILYGASLLIHGNGMPPTKLNPGLHPGMCEHLGGLARLIFKEKL